MNVDSRDHLQLANWKIVVDLFRVISVIAWNQMFFGASKIIESFERKNGFNYFKCGKIAQVAAFSSTVSVLVYGFIFQNEDTHTHKVFYLQMEKPFDAHSK